MAKRLVIFLMLVATLSEQSSGAQMKTTAVIPRPMKTEAGEGKFILSPKTAILVSENTRSVGQYLAERLAPATGFKLDVIEYSHPEQRPHSILLRTVSGTEHLGPEGYQLKARRDRVLVCGSSPAGVFYGCQTLRQLLPDEIENDDEVQGVVWSIPEVDIEDKPRFPWRGSLLDSCRYFQSKEFVKRYIDLLAYHKMNRLHWHLTEDQGWRIEIKKHPKLTRLGAWRKGRDGSKYGGFYTQEDIREIVAFAARRYVVIVPEIEMPGHAVAALTCYPELSCTGGPFEVSTRWGIHKDVYCAGNEKCFEFLEDVLSEVVELFPGPWVHIGGDECPKERWKNCPKCQARIRAEGLRNEDELQSYFIKRIEKFLSTKARRLIGWDEILEGGLSPNATVQSWRGMQGGIAAATQGHDVIMSPTSHCYLDYDYERVSVKKAYSFEPIPPHLQADNARHILGLEANMWTDRLRIQGTTVPARIDYQVFPRLCALAEVAWSPKELRHWADFRDRLQVHCRRLDAQGVICRDPSLVW